MAEKQLSISQISKEVAYALAEDIGSGDVSADLLPDRMVRAQLITREPGILCGQMWADEVLAQVDPALQCTWHVEEGAKVVASQRLATYQGPVRSLLTAERTILNFIQCLSGIASKTARYAQKIVGTNAKLLDTRKTLPGMRHMQKYAVTVGGGINHRMGLYDAVMLKENHLSAFGSLTQMVQKARAMHSNLPLIVEVETLIQCQEAMVLPIDVILLDNFSLADMKKAVDMVKGAVLLEASGNVSLETIAAIAQTGVDRISVGDLTKRIDPLDLSMRIIEEGVHGG